MQMPLGMHALGPNQQQQQSPSQPQPQQQQQQNRRVSSSSGSGPVLANVPLSPTATLNNGRVDLNALFPTPATKVELADNGQAGQQPASDEFFNIGGMLGYQQQQNPGMILQQQQQQQFQRQQQRQQSQHAQQPQQPQQPQQLAQTHLAQQQPQRQQMQPPVAPQHHMTSPRHGPQRMPTIPAGTMHRTSSAGSTKDDEDPVRPFLDGLAHAAGAPDRQAMWTHLVQLKVKALELQIAEARAKERTAEVELTRLQQGVRAIPAAIAAPTPQPYTNQFNNFSVEPRGSTGGLEGISIPGMPISNPSLAPVQNPTTYATGAPAPSQTPMTPFDLEAMLQENSLDSFFSWLPDNGESSAGNAVPQAAAPSDLVMMPMGGAGSGATTDTAPTPHSPPVKRPHSPARSESPTAPPTKKGKPRGEKKTVIEQHAMCISCGKAVARVLIRAPKSATPSPISVEMRCLSCAGISQPSTIDPSAVGAGPSVGSTETRKRMRAAMEDDDVVNEEANARRCFCDVCQRVVARGQVVGGPDRTPLSNMAEIVCTTCDSKYQRCTDCGGGGGPRVGIGKWRLKQVFQPGRKTCSLSHSRLGDRPREIGVHVTPTDFTPEQLKEVIARCKTLWTEKSLSRLAVPEMLEIDLPPNISNPLRNFADVEDIVTRCWPSREAMIRAENIDHGRFKRLLGLTWAHSRPRRSVRTVDLEGEYARAEAPNEDKDDMSTVLANVKRTNVVIPPGSELIGMWGGEWDVENGSLLVSTLIPFEGTDGEDSTALSVGELITKVQQLHGSINAERAAQGSPPVRPCEHLWVVSGGSMPLIRERMADILVRKRSFVHVEEYLTRHPDFLPALKARPVGLHPDSHRPLPHQLGQGEKYEPPQPLILVRWLGKDFDAQRILEIKQMEFGGKAKKVKKIKK